MNQSHTHTMVSALAIALVLLVPFSSLAQADRLGKEDQKQWRVYTTCLSAYMLRAAQADLDMTYEETRSPGVVRRPIDPNLLGAKARAVCRQFRVQLERPDPIEFRQQEQAILVAVKSIVKTAQEKWTRQGYFGQTAR